MGLSQARLGLQSWDLFKLVNNLHFAYQRDSLRRFVVLVFFFFFIKQLFLVPLEIRPFM